MIRRVIKQSNMDVQKTKKTNLWDAEVPELLQNKASWMSKRQNYYKLSILDTQAPELLQNKAFLMSQHQNCYKTTHSRDVYKRG